MARVLNDQQKLFLEVLFDGADGDALTAKRMAGYSDNYPTSQIISSLKDEITERTREYIARNSPKAAIRIVGVMDNPIQLGAKEVLAAAKDLLDRASIVKTEKIEISQSGIFLVPAKKEEEED